MTVDRCCYEPIGTIRTPFDDPDGMPIQPASEASARGTVVVDPAYVAGLADLDGFSHCILLYHFHAGDDDYSLRVTPFLDDTERGLFATRAPNRPNPIGLSIVAVESVDGRELAVSGVDVVDGTPLVDIKPFVPQFDVPDDTAAGWVDETEAGVESTTADDRFR
ncbi:MAG: tRNA (N6-threonylcarbamoyladenosine(37)-N6)-methyltransferase TrmO [Halohasta sp.]